MIHSKISTQKITLDPNRQYVIGTAGHIDHGKTALVKALTGVDTDRLPEEKARGITIDLGFAHLSKNITIIDVPGHERLVKNMVAGVSTIDLVLFVVAADDGVMPQSREHLDIINLLQIRHGIFVITKIDLANDEWLSLVEEDIRGLLQGTTFENIPILRTSAATGKGIETVRETLLQTLAKISPRQDQEVYRQPVDRVFSAKGFGTVITGTVLSGSLKPGEEIDIQPSGVTARVRGLQSHDSDVESVKIGDRAAVNLAGIDSESVERGMVLTRPGLFAPVEIVNARLSMLKSSPIPLKNNQRIRLHIHTAEVFARVIIPTASQLRPGESAFVQLRLENPIHASFRDRFIVRQYSPQRTIGGGVALQINPPRYRKKIAHLFAESLQRLESDDPQQIVLAAFDRIASRPLKLWQLKISSHLPLQELQALLKLMEGEKKIFKENVGGKTIYFSHEQLHEVLSRLEKILANYHDKFPGRAGLKETEIISQLTQFYPPEAIRKALQSGVAARRLVRNEAWYRLSEFTPQLSAKDSEKYLALEKCYREARFAPPTVKEAMAQFALSQKEFKELIKLLRDEGKLIFVDANLLFHCDVFPEIEAKLREFFKKELEITVPQFKDLIGTTRKHAIPLLEFLDNRGITHRHENVRKPGSRLGS